MLFNYVVNFDKRSKKAGTKRASQFVIQKNIST